MTERATVYKERERSTRGPCWKPGYHNGTMAKGIQTGEELESRAARNSSHLFTADRWKWREKEREREIAGARGTEAKQIGSQASTKSVRKRPPRVHLAPQSHKQSEKASQAQQLRSTLSLTRLNILCSNVKLIFLQITLQMRALFFLSFLTTLGFFILFLTSFEPYEIGNKILRKKLQVCLGNLLFKAHSISER